MKKSFGKMLSIIITLTMLTTLSIPLISSADQTHNAQVNKQVLGFGIEHQEIKDDHYLDTDDPQRINIVKADLNQPDVQLKTTKALDSVLEVERLSSQANREMINNDYNFVAGINGDMYTLATGMPRGMHLKNGVLFNTYGVVDPVVSPTLAIDNSGQAIIDTVTAEGTATIPSGENITVEMLNRTINNRVVLYTKDITRNSVVGLDRDGGHIVFELDAFEDIIPGEKITGKIIDYVETHVNGEKITLEDNQYVLAGYGNKANAFRELVAGETEIDIQFDVFVAGEKNNSITEAISSYNWLVQDGTALTEEDMLNLGYERSLVVTKNARTAIGITADNEIIMMTIDKQTPTDSYSTGVTLETLANAMQQAGAVTAVGLDGGGSTQMMIKSEGTQDLVVQNELSDGSERGVTNGIFINYSAEQTNDIGKVVITPDHLTIFQDGKFPFTVKATDTNGNPLSIDDRDLTWTAEKGTIDSTGNYKAPNETTTDTVEAIIDGVSGQVSINVVNELDAFSIGQEDTRALNSGQTFTFPLQAWVNNNEVTIDPSSFSWELADPNIGHIIDGVLTINENIAPNTETDVIVSIGDLEQTVHLYINKANEVIYNFNNYQLDETPFPGNKNFVSTYDYIISDKRSMSDQQSLMLDYNFGGWKTANGAMYANFYNTNEQPPKNLQADLLPQQLGMWLYSDGQEVSWVRAIIVDGEGNSHTLNVTPGNSTWSGWKFVSANISSQLPTPIHLYQLYLVETNLDYRGDTSVGGQLFFDDIQWVYDKDSVINLSELNLLIKQAQAIENNKDYTDSSFEALQLAIDQAIEASQMIDSEDALLAAVAALQLAIDGLEKEDEEDDTPEIDVTELMRLIRQAQAIENNKDYTDSSFEALQLAIDQAIEASQMIDSEDALLAAVTALQLAIDGLDIVKDVDDDNKPSDGDDDQEPNDDVADDKESSDVDDANKPNDGDEGQLPKTATPMFNIMLIGGILLALGAISFIVVNLRKNVKNK